MRCPACGVTVHDTDDFCRRCGARVVAASGLDADSWDDSRQFRQIQRDEPEETLWTGTYAFKAMFREFAVTLALCGAIWVVTGAADDAAIQFWTWPAIGIVLGSFFALVIYRRLDVSYRVSSQRLFHENGVLYRRLNRIEIIDIDDLRCEQGLIERLLGVGRIVVRSSDPTHPVLVMHGLDRVRTVYEIIDRSRRRERMRHGIHVEAV